MRERAQKEETGGPPQLLAAHRARLAPQRLGSSARAVLDLVSAERGVSIEALLRPNRGPAEVALARQLAVYLCYVTLSMPMETIGRALGRDRSTVSHACGKIEDLRDDDGFDQMVTRLEEQVTVSTAGEQTTEVRRAAG